MKRIAGFLVALFLASALLFSHISLLPAQTASSSSRWKITSIKVCRAPSGALASSIDAIGVYPVYSFFIPRPLWTVNGNLVDATPVYHQGKLVAFQLYGASEYLKSGTKNTVKFSLPDQNASKTFTYDDTRPAAGQCWEFF